MNVEYWDLENGLKIKYGVAKVTEALKALEEDYGTNGLDAYRSGNHEMLLGYFEEM